MTQPCGHDEQWTAYRNPVDVNSERYCLFCEVERLRAENDKLREISLRRYVSCMSGGCIKDDVYVATSWRWSCSLCGAESYSDIDSKDLLDHEADCPIRWVREAARSET